MQDATATVSIPATHPPDPYSSYSCVPSLSPILPPTARQGDLCAEHEEFELAMSAI
jgi:hypothetical protein